MLKTNLYHTIDLRTVYHSHGLLARKIWQVLFDYYRADNGDLENLDSLLCDLGIIERKLVEDSHKDCIEFSWECGYQGYTDIKFDEFAYPRYSSSLLVKVDLRNQKIEFFHNAGE